jgi:hypothetical protein
VSPLRNDLPVERPTDRTRERHDAAGAPRIADALAALQRIGKQSGEPRIRTAGQRRDCDLAQVLIIDRSETLARRAVAAVRGVSFEQCGCAGRQVRAGGSRGARCDVAGGVDDRKTVEKMRTRRARPELPEGLLGIRHRMVGACAHVRNEAVREELIECAERQVGVADAVGARDVAGPARSRHHV